jgi:hypothetical protein
MVRFALILALVFAGATGCASTRSPELRVLGVQDQRRHEVVVVQVTNPASRPMRLTKLEYRFAAAGGTTVSEGELDLYRDIPAGAAVVVEVPLDGTSEQPMTLRGKLTAELDQIVRIFKVSAQIDPAK